MSPVIVRSRAGHHLGFEWSRPLGSWLVRYGFLRASFKNFNLGPSRSRRWLSGFLRDLGVHVVQALTVASIGAQRLVFLAEGTVFVCILGCSFGNAFLVHILEFVTVAFIFGLAGVLLIGRCAGKGVN